MSGDEKIKKLLRGRYDAVIIGAGLSGLVCGCYLSGSGARVLIVEKNDKAGGYFSSFRKRGYRFNLTTSIVGGFRDTGLLNKIFMQELMLKGKLKIEKDDYTHTVVTKDWVFDFSRDAGEISKKLSRIFPAQKGAIEDFFTEVTVTPTVELYAKYKNIFFMDLLNDFFSDRRLKNFFTILCGNFGVSPHKISAFSALIYYKEAVLDGGYYIKGGAQGMSEALLDKFRNNKGRLLLSVKVKSLGISQGKVGSLVLESGERITTESLVICCDWRQFMPSLLKGKREVESLKKLSNKMKVTSSAFICYLGLKKPIPKGLFKSRNVWLCPECDIDRIFGSIERGDFPINDSSYLLCNISSSKGNQFNDQLTLYVPAPFKNRDYWDRYKERFLERLIQRSSPLINGLEENIRFKDAVSPFELFASTMNFKGAMRGWASIPGQNDTKLVPQGSLFENLFFAGQWATVESGQGGIAMSSFSGRRAAKAVLKYNLN